MLYVQFVLFAKRETKSTVLIHCMCSAVMLLHDLCDINIFYNNVFVKFKVSACTVQSVAIFPTLVSIGKLVDLQ